MTKLGEAVHGLGARFMVCGLWFAGYELRLIVRVLWLPQYGRVLWFAVDGSRCMVRGLRLAFYGSRFMVRSLWFAVYGSRWMVCGLWFLVYGSRFIVCGLSQILKN